jgi:hypothetical protein
MKKINKVQGLVKSRLAVIAAVALTLALTACDILQNNVEDGDRTAFTSVKAFGEWLEKQPENTPETSYRVKLNIKELDKFDLSNALGSNKYVYIDFSGSTFTTIPDNTFAYPTIGDYRPTLTGIIIPDSVTSIGSYGLGGCTSLNTLTIPNSVTSIGMGAFESCTSLKSITLPNSVTSMGVSAFKNCTSLTSAAIPNGVTSIRYGTFSGCTSLKSVTIPDSVTEIEGRAFENCTSLTGVTIPNNVTSIRINAFENCTSLTSVTIPSSVTDIDQGVFGGCNSLTSVTFEGTITQDNFHYWSPFPGDLREKYLDAEDGGPGTYTRDSGGYTGTWTKQP